MLGANWKVDPQHTYKKKFAWWPVRSGTGKLIWLKNYVVRFTHYDHNGKPPVKGPYWTYVYTSNEYLVKELKGE